MRYLFLVLLAFLLVLLFASPRDASGFQLTSWAPFAFVSP
jgi:hypothetical protein